jgi:hypothetical protein
VVSVLVEFKVGNYLSFDEPVKLSMVASRIQEHRETHVLRGSQDMPLLPPMALYGANASGKTNLFRAMRFMSDLVKNSSKDSQADEEIGVQGFRLREDAETLPSLFEVSFICDAVLYRYGFEVDRHRVHKEWLFYRPKRTEILLFKRDQQSINVGSGFAEARGLESKTRENALFLSVVAQFNGDISRKILKWFSQFVVISAAYNRSLIPTVRALTDDSNRVLEVLKAADIGIEGIGVDVDDPLASTSNGPRQRERVYTEHKIFDRDQHVSGVAKFDLMSEESEGTQKLFSLIAPILRSLEGGWILAIDEVDARLHPLITEFLIQFFHSPDSNRNGAQLLLTTHDTNLLTRRIFRRDQIWFVEKNRYGASDLYSLADYHIRNDATYQKDYLLGKYGGIPYMGPLEWADESTRE